MSKIEVITDRIDMESKRLIIEMGVPLDFLKEAISKGPENIKPAFATAFATAMDDFIVKKNLVK